MQGRSIVLFINSLAIAIVFCVKIKRWLHGYVAKRIACTLSEITLRTQTKQKQPMQCIPRFYKRVQTSHTFQISDSFKVKRSHLTA